MTINPQAFIFDMDDLLIRSGEIWDTAAQKLLSQIGQQWTPELGAQYKGMNAMGVASTMHGVLELHIPLDNFRAAYRDALLAEFSVAVDPMPGAVDLVRRLHPLRPMALASGSPLQVIENVLARLEIRDCFQVVITSESVERGKPHPDVFLKAAELLGVPPADCLVFEDSLVGVQAARAAGMQCFAVPSGRAAEIEAIATSVFTSLAEVSHAHVGLSAA